MLFFLRCLRYFEKWSCFEKIGKNEEKWGKMAVPEPPLHTYFRVRISTCMNTRGVVGCIGV